MTIDVNIDMNICPKNSFYLQWPDIYWWQVNFNIELLVKQSMCELIELSGDVE